MLAQRHEIARLQSDFYRDQFRKILRWVIVALVLVFILLFTIIYLILFHPTARYYANTTNGVILAMPNVKSK